jgi:hypothetical protein
VSTVRRSRARKPAQPTVLLYGFIMAARQTTLWDFLRSAAIIMKNNPLGGVCGMVCPDRHCMAECSRKLPLHKGIQGENGRCASQKKINDRG